MKDLYSHLSRDPAFQIGCGSVRRYVTKHWPDRKKIQSFQRIETPPGSFRTGNGTQAHGLSLQ